MNHQTEVSQNDGMDRLYQDFLTADDHCSLLLNYCGSHNSVNLESVYREAMVIRHRLHVFRHDVFQVGESRR